MLFYRIVIVVFTLAFVINEAHALSAYEPAAMSKVGKDKDAGDTSEVSSEDDEDGERPFDENCPSPPKPPQIVTSELISSNNNSEREEPNAEITEISTNIVNNEFFATPENYFNFLRLVYEKLDDAIGLYRSENDLEEKAIFTVFKGGNLLRMVAYKTFGLLPMKANYLLKYNYSEYFKRSDTDFAVYIDGKKLGELKFDKVYNDVSDRVFVAVDKIRQELIKEPKKYFAIFGLEKEEEITDIMNKYFSELKNISAINNPKNKKWFKARFNQLQLLDFRGNEEGPYCPYIGEFDTKYEIKNNKLTITPMSKEPNWIVNSEFKSIDKPWGADPSKKSKFSLSRAKVAIDYRFDKFGEPERRNVGADLLDVAVTHRDDGDVRGLLTNYDENIINYKITLRSTGEALVLPAYSVPYLATDLRAIFFETFDRPWKMGEKYTKRVYRFFLLAIIEMLGAYGVGSEKIAEYTNAIKENLLIPMSQVYSDKNAIKAAKKIEVNATKISKKWPKMKETNAFFSALAKVISLAIAKPEEGDEEELKALLALIEKNIAIAEKLSDMPVDAFNISNVYSVDMGDIF